MKKVNLEGVVEAKVEDPRVEGVFAPPTLEEVVASRKVMPTSLRRYIFAYYSKSLRERGRLPSKEESFKAIREVFGPSSTYCLKIEREYSYYKGLFQNFRSLGEYLK